jgi:tRNA(Arg) A34 adenosine deaminase TadA
MIPPSLIRTASKSTHGKFFHAAQVQVGGRTLSVGYNKGLGGPDREGMWTVHAEVMAIRRALYYRESLKGTTVVSIRVTRQGRLANARPCAACMKAIINAGVKRIIFSTSQGTLEEVRT